MTDRKSASKTRHHGGARGRFGEVGIAYFHYLECDRPLELMIAENIRFRRVTLLRSIGVVWKMRNSQKPHEDFKLPLAF